MNSDWCAARVAAGLTSVAGLALVGVLSIPFPLHSQGPACRDSPNIPLPDLSRDYRGLRAGLYPGGRTTPPEEHLALGLERSSRIRALDVNGRPSEAGRIILLSIGMSNTNSEFGRFIADARNSGALNSQLTIVNGALSGADAAMWADPASRAWQHATTAVRGRDTSAAQVQAVWLKQAHLRTVPFPDEVEQFTRNLEAIVRIAKARFPNLQIVYVSSRTRSGAETRRGPGEPQAYETAFAVRRLIERQPARAAGGDDAPWITWGPYLWATATPRSDGFAWECGDLQQDLLHPSNSGNVKVAAQLMSFFMTEPTAWRWFLDRAHRQDGTLPEIRPSVGRGASPLTVDFSATAAGATAFHWSFGDGTSSRAPTPRKTFHVAGHYDVRLTVTDAAGRWAQSSIQIHAGAGSPRAALP